jgi:hypothetical protein
VNNTTKRFARTLHEAFGPHTSQQIEDDEPPPDRGEFVLLWGCGAIALALGVCLSLGVI